jgi:DNA-directed RNA polymerase specialized sigma subunit
MIRSEAEYKEALRRLDEDRKFAEQQRWELVKEGYTPEEVERGMAPLLSFQAQLEEEVAWYEAVKARNFPVIRRLTQVGRLLIALRIANSLTQRELAERLGVSEAQVSRDERNEYHGITLERAQRILDALEESIATRVEKVPPAEEPLYAGVS